MFVKFSASGQGSTKFVVSWVIFNILMLVLWIFDAVIPFGKTFIMLLQTSLNSGKWDLLSLLTPVFWVLIYGIVCEVILAVIGFILYKIVISK